MAQRISRVKGRIKASGAQFHLPPEGERADRLRSVLHALYLVFKRGLHRHLGAYLQRGELTMEAIRLTRSCVDCCPTTAR